MFFFLPSAFCRLITELAQIGEKSVVQLKANFCFCKIATNGSCFINYKNGLKPTTLQRIAGNRF